MYNCAARGLNAITNFSHMVAAMSKKWVFYQVQRVAGRKVVM